MVYHSHQLAYSCIIIAHVLDTLAAFLCIIMLLALLFTSNSNVRFEVLHWISKKSSHLPYQYDLVGQMLRLATNKNAKRTNLEGPVAHWYPTFEPLPKRSTISNSYKYLNSKLGYHIQIISNCFTTSSMIKSP
jgi:hypothetical protein